MKDLTTIFPTEVKELAKFNPAGYWELPHNMFVTDNESIMIAIIDSATDETIVLFWDNSEQTWFHYTNCFGLGEGNDVATKSLISEWLETASG